LASFAFNANPNPSIISPEILKLLIPITSPPASIKGPPEFAEAVDKVGGVIESIQLVLETIQTILDIVKEPLALAESITRALLSADGFEQALMALAPILAEILGTLLEANAWFLPIFPQSVERLMRGQNTFGWSVGPTYPDEVQDAQTKLIEAVDTFFNESLTSLHSFTDEFYAPGVGYITSTLENALNDVWDPDRPLLGDKAYVGGMVLIAGASEPAALGPAAELLTALTESTSAVQFLASMAQNFVRLAGTEVRDQGNWPDFYKAPLIEIIPTLADGLRALQDFMKVVEASYPLYTEVLIETIKNLISFFQYIVEICEGIVYVVRLIASLNASIVAVPPTAIGPHGFVEAIRTAINPPTFTYAVGLIAMVGAENYEDIDFGYQALQAIFPIS